MHPSLPNATAQAVGFTIPGRSSSLQDHAKRVSKHSKKSSLDKSRDEVAERMRSISLGSREAKIRNRVSFDGSHVAERMPVKRPSSSSSTSSSSPPVSLYKNYDKPLSDRNGDLLRQASLKIKTYRAAGVPDPRNSPDISAHPANSLPESPIDPWLSPTPRSVDAHPFNTPPAAQGKDSFEPPLAVAPPLSRHPAFSANHTEEETVTVNKASTVTHSKIHQEPENISQKDNTRDVHFQDSYNYPPPIKKRACAPAQHFATGLEGKVIKIPGALGESLEIFRQREARMALVGMGWD
jgi:hypothetical protein